MCSADLPLAGSVTAASQRGPVHGENEDRWTVLGADDLLLLAVADGMGGTSGGGTAAGIALQSLLELGVTRPAPSADPEPTLSLPYPPLRALADPGDPADPADPADPDMTLEPPPPDPPAEPARAAAGPPASAGPPDVSGAAGNARTELSDPDREPGGEVGSAVLAAMHRAHQRVLAAAPAGLPEALRPGSTLTIALVLGDRLVVGHVGDSACWLVRRGALIRLTEEHTHAAVLVAAGAVERGSPAARRLENLLTRHLGMPGEFRPQLTVVRLTAGDRLLLASDGLSRTVPAPVLSALLARPDTTAGRLVGAAVAAGARDDVTALLATVGGHASGYAAPVGAAAVEPGDDPLAPHAEEPHAAAGR